MSDYAALWMRVDGGGKVIKFDNMEDRPVKGTTEWKRCSVVLTHPRQLQHKIRFSPERKRLSVVERMRLRES